MTRSCTSSFRIDRHGNLGRRRKEHRPGRLTHRVPVGAIGAADGVEGRVVDRRSSGSSARALRVSTVKRPVLAAVRRAAKVARPVGQLHDRRRLLRRDGAVHVVPGDGLGVVHHQDDHGALQQRRGLDVGRRHRAGNDHHVRR